MLLFISNKAFFFFQISPLLIDYSAYCKLIFHKEFSLKDQGSLHDFLGPQSISSLKPFQIYNFLRGSLGIYSKLFSLTKYLRPRLYFHSPTIFVVITSHKFADLFL